MRFLISVLTGLFAVNLLLAGDPIPQIDLGAEIMKKSLLQSSGIHHLELSVLSATTYRFSYSSDGVSWFNEGDFTFHKNQMSLRPTVCKASQEGDALPCQKTFGAGFCKIIANPMPIYFVYAVECTSKNNNYLLTNLKKINKVTFDFEALITPKGSQLKVNGISLITLGRLAGVTNTNAKIRKGPGIKYEQLDYVVNAYDGPIHPHMPMGTKIFVYARTVEKVKVENWENYWYLIDAGDTRKAWVYGEFLRLEE